MKDIIRERERKREMKKEREKGREREKTERERARETKIIPFTGQRKKLREQKKVT